MFFGFGISFERVLPVFILIEDGTGLPFTDMYLMLDFCIFPPLHSEFRLGRVRSIWLPALARL